MRTRVVTHVHREDGRIVELSGSNWGPVGIATAIKEIEGRRRAYAVYDVKLNPIFVVYSIYRRYLRTHPNSLRNLEDLDEPEARQGTRVVTEVHFESGAIGELLGRDWGPVEKATAIDEIERGEWRYAVADEPRPNPIGVVHSRQGNYLRTPPDVSRRTLGQL